MTDPRQPISGAGSGYLIKSVRNLASRIPDQGKIEYRPLFPGQIRVELLKKLSEEVTEYTITPSPEELADVLEVVRSIASYTWGMTLNELALLGSEKSRIRGTLCPPIGMYNVK